MNYITGLKKNILRILAFSNSSKIALLLLVEIISGVILTMVMLGIFLKLGEDVLTKDVVSFDSSITHFIYTFRTPLMTSIMNTISFFGGEMFLGIAIIITIILLIRKHRKDALIFSFILFFGLGLNLLLKDFFQRPRPHFLSLVHEYSYSFPSGHAMNSLVFYVSLSYFIFRNTRNKIRGLILSILCGVFIISIGISRIYLGAHYPTDVIAGYAAGLCWFLIVVLFEKTLIFLQLMRKYELDKKY